MTNRIALLAITAVVLFCTPAIATLNTYRAHGPINQIIDFSETDTTYTYGFGSVTWVDLPNASLKLIIPQGPTQLVMVRFTAEAEEYGTDAAAWCSVRILAGNAPMLPDTGVNFRFLSNAVAGSVNDVGAAMDRSLALGPCTYTIKVQYTSSHINDKCSLGPWHLNVQTADYGVSPGTAPRVEDSGQHRVIGR